MLIDFREKGKSREKETAVEQKYQLFASHIHPNWGSNQQPRHVPSIMYLFKSSAKLG